jgi:hypothetical protein
LNLLCLFGVLCSEFAVGRPQARRRMPAGSQDFEPNFFLSPKHSDVKAWAWLYYELQVSALGLGCRSLSSAHERPVEEKDALDVINHAFDNGVTFFDTSDFYGTKHSNENLLGVV